MTSRIFFSSSRIDRFSFVRHMMTGLVVIYKIYSRTKFTEWVVCATKQCKKNDRFFLKSDQVFWVDFPGQKYSKQTHQWCMNIHLLSTKAQYWMSRCRKSQLTKANNDDHRERWLYFVNVVSLAISLSPTISRLTNRGRKKLIFVNEWICQAMRFNEWMNTLGLQLHITVCCFFLLPRGIC